MTVMTAFCIGVCFRERGVGEGGMSCPRPPTRLAGAAVAAADRAKEQ
jgi:hypothetical protein